MTHELILVTFIFALIASSAISTGPMLTDSCSSRPTEGEVPNFISGGTESSSQELSLCELELFAAIALLSWFRTRTANFLVVAVCNCVLPRPLLEGGINLV